MNEAALLQMIVPSSAAQLIGKQGQIPTASSNAEDPEAATVDQIGAVFAELLVVEPDDLVQQIAQPEPTAELALPLANSLSVTSSIQIGEVTDGETVDPAHPLIQGQNPNLQELPPAIAVTDQGDVFTGLSEVPDVAPAGTVAVEEGQQVTVAATADLGDGDAIVGSHVEPQEQENPEAALLKRAIAVEDVPADIEEATDQSAELLATPAKGAEESAQDVGLIDGIAPAPVTEPNVTLSAEQPVLASPDTGQAEVVSEETANGPVNAAAPITAATNPAANIDQPKPAVSAPQNQGSQPSAGQDVPPSQTADALPDDQADVSILKAADAPTKPAQTADRPATGDQTTDRLTSDAAKPGQLTDQGGQFSDGRGEDRKGQQSSPLIFTAAKDGSADVRPATTADRGQNSSFANALLGGGNSAELDSSYDQMPARLRIAVANGVKQLTVHLQPASLGSMEVRLDGTEDGGLRATFLVQRPETLDLLQRDARVLERALGDAGVSVDRDSLNFSLSDQGNRNGGMAEDGEQSGAGLSEGPTDDGSNPNDESLETDIPLDTAAIIEAGRIDVHI